MFGYLLINLAQFLDWNILFFGRFGRLCRRIIFGKHACCVVGSPVSKRSLTNSLTKLDKINLPEPRPGSSSLRAFPEQSENLWPSFSAKIKSVDPSLFLAMTESGISTFSLLAASSTVSSGISSAGMGEILLSESSTADATVVESTWSFGVSNMIC